PPGLLDHLAAALGLQVDADLLDVAHALRLEQGLGAKAVRAPARRVHQDAGHALRLLERQPRLPPRLHASRKREHVLEAVLAQQRRDASRAVAALAVDDD